MVQVRQEQQQVRGSPQAPVTGDNVGQMTYTRQVVREVLRYRPPAPMVPQVGCSNSDWRRASCMSPVPDWCLAFMALSMLALAERPGLCCSACLPHQRAVLHVD